MSDIKTHNNIKANSRFALVTNSNFSRSKRSNSRSQSDIKIKLLPDCKRSQVTVFIILAIVIITGILLFFIFKGSLTFGNPPIELQPVYNYYLNCIEQETLLGANILGQQGGYIKGPEFSPGSVYMPFSSYLGFSGLGIPYWYYISGNGIIKEQVPSKEIMQNELNDFLNERIIFCDFSEFQEKGFIIEIGEPEIKTKIINNKIEVSVYQILNINSGNVSWSSKKHFKEVNSNLGKFYELSKKIYDDFKETMFLENYGVDILRLYAPVDGVEISCAPKIWNVEEVRENLTRALETNIPQTKIKGSYYKLKKPENKYFVHDIPAIGEADVNINFLFSRNWPNKIEVWPNDQGLLLAEPIGLQEGLGMLGFCYVPYHFVYDLAYPVLIQMYYNDELFQFPVVVYVNKNRPRTPINGTSLPNVVPELCLYKNTEIEVSTFNVNLEPIEAEIEFKCFDTSCYIGKTQIKNKEPLLKEKFPQCANGFIIATSPGYETKKELFSTINPGSISIFLDKKYPLEIEITSSGEKLSSNSYAVITFRKNDTTNQKTTTIAYPEQTQIELSSGQYQIKTHIYSNSKIKLEGSSEQKCIDIPKSGFLSIFGVTEKKCFTLEIPNQEVEFAISGGGTQSYYISESELENSKKIIIDATKFPTPSKIDDIQINYNLIDHTKLNINFE